MTTIALREFDSISELGRYLREAKALPASSDGGRRDGASSSWDLGIGYQGALDMALAGGSWAEGAKQLRRAMIETERLCARAPLPELVRSVAGFAPDVPGFCAGNPCAMWNEQADEDGLRQRSRIIRIGVSTNMWQGVPAPHCFNRGAALLSVIDTLEAEGMRVELTAVSIYQNHDGTPHRHLAVTIKRAEDQWSAESAAFALCHAGYHRRLGFAVADSNPETLSASNNGYCYEIGDRWASPDFDVCYPRVHKGAMDRFASAESALRYVIEYVNKGIAAMSAREEQAA